MDRRAGVLGGLVVLAMLAVAGCAGATAPAAAPGSMSGSAPAAVRPRLDEEPRRTVAMQLVSSAENSTLDWQAQYGYIEDIGDGRGYTGGIIGFTSATGDMLDVVSSYTTVSPDNPLAPFVPALRAVVGTESHDGLGEAFEAAWRSVAEDPAFHAAQDAERDRVYLDPAVSQGLEDGLGALGQFAYYDALVVHGPGDEWPAFGAIRDRARAAAPTPTDGGDETAYLTAFLDARDEAMRSEAAHDDTSRVDTAQRVFLAAGNLDLTPPLTWRVYGDEYTIP
jgi:chitosanase